MGLALRRNPKRAHLLVSRVLAKHVPTEPGLVIAAGELLGLLVCQELADSVQGAARRRMDRRVTGAVIDEAAAKLAALLALDSHGPERRVRPRQRTGRRDARLAAVGNSGELLASQRTRLPGVVTIGYAETATGLGRLVARPLGAYYIHSTRHARTAASAALGAFEETAFARHLARLLPTTARLDAPGRWSWWTTSSAPVHHHQHHPRTARHGPARRYVVAALVDLRTARGPGQA